MARAKRYQLSGKWLSLDEIERERVRMVNQANARLRRLEAKGYDRYAYERAMLYLKQSGKGKRFKRKKPSSAAEILSQVDALTRFLEAKTSTVTGLEKVEAKAVAQFESRGFELKNKKEFFNFLSSSIYRELLQKHYASGLLQEFYDKAQSQNYSDAEIRELLEEYRRGETDVKTLSDLVGVSIL
jgi:hypothetical protein